MGWVGIRLLVNDIADHANVPAQITDSAPDRPSPPPGNPRVGSLPEGAIVTPYGLLIPFGTDMETPLPDSEQAARLAGPPLPGPASRQVQVTPFHGRYRSASVAPRAAAPTGPLIGYRLFDGAPIHALPGARLLSPPAMRTPAPASVTVPPPRLARATSAPAPLDRWQLSAWAFQREQAAGTASLAPGSTLGGDQAGARLIYNLSRHLGVTVRASTATGSIRGDEVALGVRFRPFPDLPLALTAERREAIGDGPAARSAFAVFAETGLYDRPLGLGFDLDAYAQAGVVGIEERDWFIDGAATATRPLLGRISVGAGVWGGAQPGIERLDIGPRVSLPLWKKIRLHADYRARVAGNAAPGSGPALTLAADF